MTGNNHKCVWALAKKDDDADVVGSYIMFEAVNAGIRLCTFDYVKFNKIKI